MSPKFEREPVTSSVAGNHVSQSAIVNQLNGESLTFQPNVAKFGLNK